MLIWSLSKSFTVLTITVCRVLLPTTDKSSEGEIARPAMGLFSLISRKLKHTSYNFEYGSAHQNTHMQKTITHQRHIRASQHNHFSTIHLSTLYPKCTFNLNCCKMWYLVQPCIHCACGWCSHFVQLLISCVNHIVPLDTIFQSYCSTGNKFPTILFY